MPQEHADLESVAVAKDRVPDAMSNFGRSVLAHTWILCKQYNRLSKLHYLEGDREEKRGGGGPVQE